jgi:hypothetical protein
MNPSGIGLRVRELSSSRKSAARSAAFTDGFSFAYHNADKHKAAPVLTKMVFFLSKTRLSRSLKMGTGSSSGASSKTQTRQLSEREGCEKVIQWVRRFISAMP